MHLQRHLVVAPPEVSLGRVRLDAEDLVQVGGLKELQAPLEQSHRDREASWDRGADAAWVYRRLRSGERTLSSAALLSAGPRNIWRAGPSDVRVRAPTC